MAEDLRTVFGDAAAYVMLSRVQALNQLFIIGSLPVEKIRTSKKCLAEVERLESKSVNRNPPLWEQDLPLSVKISSLNCRSLCDKLVDIRSDPILHFSDIICLSETWLKDRDVCVDDYRIDGYQSHFNCYSEGRGKGLAVYHKKGQFHARKLITSSTIQASIVFSDELEIICIYRGNSCQVNVDAIFNYCNPHKTTVICGDMNFCFKKKKHPWIQEFLYRGFWQLVTQPTHITGGHIDQLYIRDKTCEHDVDVSLYSPFYVAKDHDAVCAVVTKKGSSRRCKNNELLFLCIYNIYIIIYNNIY